jgi:nucleoside-diphosphate-sugar epimerase
MIEHTSRETMRLSRVVILGASGVIGRALTPFLVDRGVSVATLESSELDLLDPDAPRRLAGLLRHDDALVVLAGIPPRRGRDLATMVRNIQMAINVCAALSRQPVAHIIYLSSDAVYPRSVEDVSETSPIAPTDSYSAMHLVREDLFRRLVSAPVAVFRSTQICAVHDTHDAYGPSRFLRMAMKEKRIVLFGRGEETRDHIQVEDVAALIHACLMRRSQGVLNVATGRSLSFADVASLVAAQFDPPPEIQYAPRQLPVTHRTFDVSALVRAFPEMSLTPLEAGLARIVRQVASTRSS